MPRARRPLFAISSVHLMPGVSLGVQWSGMHRHCHVLADRCSVSIRLTFCPDVSLSVQWIGKRQPLAAFPSRPVCREAAAQHRCSGDELDRRFGEFRVPPRPRLTAGSLGGSAAAGMPKRKGQTTAWLRGLCRPAGDTVERSAIGCASRHHTYTYSSLLLCSLIDFADT